MMKIKKISLIFLNVIFINLLGYTQNSKLTNDLLSGIKVPISKHAIGLRLSGGFNNNGFGVSYQLRLAEARRLDFGMDQAHSGKPTNNDHLVISTSYHFMGNIIRNLNWYGGPTAAILVANGENNSGVGAGLGLQLGLEYHLRDFDLPILVSLDSRPMRGFVDTHRGFIGLSLSFRYTWDY